MKRIALLLAPLALAACGVSETASTAATVAAMKAQEAKQGQAAKEQLINQLDAADKQAEQRLKDAEAK